MLLKNLDRKLHRNDIELKLLKIREIANKIGEPKKQLTISLGNSKEKLSKLKLFTSLRATSGVISDTRLSKFQLTKCCGQNLIELQSCDENFIDSII